MATQRAGILGTGHAYPEGILTMRPRQHGRDSDEWITTRTGINSAAKPLPGIHFAFAVKAARQAIERAGLDSC